MNYVSLLILAVTGIAFLILVVGQGAPEVSRAQLRSRLIHNWQRVQIRARTQFRNDELTDMFRAAGLRLTSETFMWIRITVVVFGALYAIGAYFTTHSAIPFILPFALWLVTANNSYLPLRTALTFLAQQHALQLNKDIYLLYVLIKQDLQAYAGKRRSVYDILTELTPLVPRLQRALYRCLTTWPKDPHRALNQLANELHSDKAEQLTKILEYIEESRIEVALDILDKQYADFQKERVAWFKQKLYFRGLVAFVLAFVGVGSVALDFVHLISIYTHDLLQFQSLQ